METAFQQLWKAGGRATRGMTTEQLYRRAKRLDVLYLAWQNAKPEKKQRAWRRYEAAVRSTMRPV
jgi:hypothetical protein